MQGMSWALPKLELLKQMMLSIPLCLVCRCFCGNPQKCFGCVSTKCRGWTSSAEPTSAMMFCQEWKGVDPYANVSGVLQTMPGRNNKLHTCDVFRAQRWNSSIKAPTQPGWHASRYCTHNDNLSELHLALVEERWFGGLTDLLEPSAFILDASARLL